MHLQTIALALTIGILYVLFVSLLSAEIFRDSKEDCYLVGNNKERELCYDKRMKVENKKFAMCIILGILAIFGSYFFGISENGLGMALAGIFTIFATTSKHWNTLQSRSRLIIVGSHVVVLLLSSKRMSEYTNLVLSK